MKRYKDLERSENNEIKLTNKFKAFFAILFPNQDIFQKTIKIVIENYQDCDRKLSHNLKKKLLLNPF